MPVAAPKPCRHPGCNALVRGGRCEKHKRDEQPRAHGSAGIRKTGRAGVRDRERIKHRDNGLCQECYENGRVIEGTEVDHIIPLDEGGADTDENKRLLCHECHARKSKDEAKRRARRRRWGAGQNSGAF